MAIGVPPSRLPPRPLRRDEPARPAIASTLVVVSLARGACRWTLIGRFAKGQDRQENDP